MSTGWLRNYSAPRTLTVMPAKPPRPTLTIGEAARELGVSRRRVNALILEGRLPSEKVGRIRLIQRTDLGAVRDRKPGRPRTLGEAKVATHQRYGKAYAKLAK